MSFLSSFNASDEPERFDGLAAFDQVEAATEREPLPSGTYNVRVISGCYGKTRSDKDAYKMTFEVIDGPHAGRRPELDLHTEGLALCQAGLGRIRAEQPECASAAIPR